MLDKRDGILYNRQACEKGILYIYIYVWIHHLDMR